MNRQRERAELETVLASTLFLRAPELCKILRYVCEKEFSNESDTIKEYSIAVEALGRGPEFRPEENNIVRVQAARLRKHLTRYYETDGAGHPVQIRLSATGYKPEFVHGGMLEDRDPGVADERDSIEGPSGWPTDSLSAETLQPAGVVGESDPGAALNRPGAPRASLSRGKFGLLALLATALIVAVVGATLKYRSGASSVRPPSAVPATTDPLSGVKVRAGRTHPTFLDAAGSTWLGDRFFSGGEIFSQPDVQILRTLDKPIYHTGRVGSFGYAIPLRQGVYELHLHFAEIFFGLTAGADTQRVFDVSLNGAPLMTAFDIAKDAGGVYIADEKIFKDASPGKDGLLRLGFSSVQSQALLNGIEALPGVRGKMLPVRILCSQHPGLDRNGQLWRADQYFSGGRISELAEPIPDLTLGGFSSYRIGNFNYAIPVADGTYRIRLIFAEPIYGHNAPSERGAGRRVFDVYCNGKTLASGIDVFKEAGGGYRVSERTFGGLKPDAQGKLLLSFVPVRNYAVLMAIEVLDATW